MSNRAITWAFDQEALPTIDRFVLVVLADYADEANSCYPGQTLIARRTGSSVSTVHRSLKRLETGGWIQRVKRWKGDGTRSSDRYELKLKRDDPPCG